MAEMWERDVVSAGRPISAEIKIAESLMLIMCHHRDLHWRIHHSGPGEDQSRYGHMMDKCPFPANCYLAGDSAGLFGFDFRVANMTLILGPNRCSL